MHNLIQFLSIANIGSNLSTSTCPPYTYTNVVNCYRSYFEYFNLTIGPNLEFPDYQTYKSNRAKLESTSEVVDFINDCYIRNRLASCLGIDTYCINPDDLSKIGKFKYNDNFQYSSDYSMTSYECTTEYNYIINNYNCLINVNYLSQDEISNCVENYFKNIPSEGQYPAINDYISCFDTVYSTHCGEKAGDLFCNVLTIGDNIQFPECNGKLMTCNSL
uniref:DUF19 domain-containing protein n=1 Tax=Strongyloides papillosus TaxID=174720 RepID=A0A0N5BF11_STREA